MTKTSLPAVMLTCRNGHGFMTRARGGSTVRCPECGVPKRVPADRPLTERAARELADRAVVAEAPAAGSELDGRWEREAPWNDRLPMLTGRAECPECDGPLQWEPGRTVTYCPECKQVALPAAVAEHYQRQSQHGAEVAIRTGPGAAEVRAARVRLNALKTRMTDRLDEWLEVFDPDDLNGGPARIALDYSAELGAYRAEIKGADDEYELADIMAEVNEIIERAQASGAVDAIERQRETTERQAEYAEQQAKLAEYAERQHEQAEREAEREAQRRAAIEAQQRKAIENRKPAAVSSQNGYLTAGVQASVMIAHMAQAAERNRLERERKLNEYGPCGYKHRKPTIPERRYWITTLNWQGNRSGYELPDSPAVAVCGKHFAVADQWIQEQAALIAGQRGVSVLAVHTELK